MKIIALDSSGLVASVALLEDTGVVGEYNIQYKKTHSQTLLPMLEELKKQVELELSTVDAIAIASGPGSFTGLRIGSATAKGLAYALQIPIIEIPTLQGLACNLYGTDKLVCPIMDARREQVYTGLYAFEKNENTGEIGHREPDHYTMKAVLSDRPVSVAEISQHCNELDREVIFLGDGVPVYREKLKELMKVPYQLAPAHMNRQRAAAFGVLAFDWYAEGRYVSAMEHAPEYLRLSQAERERNHAD